MSILDIKCTEGQLREAAKYPFTSYARKIVKGIDFSPDQVPQEVFVRSRLIIKQLVNLHPSWPDSKAVSQRELQNEVLAYPVSKIIISLMNDEKYYDKFANAVGDLIQKNLHEVCPAIGKNSSDGDSRIFKRAILDLAQDIKIPINFSQKFKWQINFADYVKLAPFVQNQKLVNKKIEKGIVFLNDFECINVMVRAVVKKVRKDLPVPTQELPEKFSLEADRLNEELPKYRRKIAEAESFGSIETEAFPPCFESIYHSLKAGENAPHMARFSISTFLVGIGMLTEDIVNLFRNVVNFNERTTTYHVERLKDSTGNIKYTCPNCSKMLSLALCPQPQICADWKVAHPLQFYRKKHYLVSKDKEKENEKK